MKIRSNKTKPIPERKHSEASPITIATKSMLDPLVFDLMGSVKEKKVDKVGKIKMSDMDIFGEPIKFNWNKSGSYKTNTGVMFSGLYCVVLGFITWTYFGEFM
jgi:hypothetical protein